MAPVQLPPLSVSQKGMQLSEDLHSDWRSRVSPWFFFPGIHFYVPEKWMGGENWNLLPIPNRSYHWYLSCCMCKIFGKRIRSLFCSIFIHIGLCARDLTVRRLDATYYPVRKCIWRVLIRAVDKIFAFYDVQNRPDIDQDWQESNIKKADTRLGRFFLSLAISLSLRRCSLSSSFSDVSFRCISIVRPHLPSRIYSPWMITKHQDGTHERYAPCSLFEYKLCHWNQTWLHHCNESKYLKTYSVPSPSAISL